MHLSTRFERLLTDLLLLFPWTSTSWSVISAIKIREEFLGVLGAFNKSYILSKGILKISMYLQNYKLSSQPCLPKWKNWELHFYTSYHKKNTLHYAHVQMNLLSLSIHMIFLVPLSPDPFISWLKPMSYLNVPLNIKHINIYHS